MLIVISPAKTLDFETQSMTNQFTQPEFLEESSILVDILRKFSPTEISTMMKISNQLSQLNAARFQAWSTPFNLENSKQALLAFKGDVYTGLAAEELNKQQFIFAQKHLRILSGLYGLLRPLDLIQPYRLEMGTKLKNERGDNLYKFWGCLITEKLNKDLSSDKTPTLINLASNEYFKSIQEKKINGQIITPVFKDRKNGQYKIISFYAKKARGLMCRYIINHSIDHPEQMKNFNYDGYLFNENMSSEIMWIYTRDGS